MIHRLDSDDAPCPEYPSGHVLVGLQQRSLKRVNFVIGCLAAATALPFLGDWIWSLPTIKVIEAFSETDQTEDWRRSRFRSSCYGATTVRWCRTRMLPFCSRRVSEEALVGAAEGGLRLIADAEANLTYARSSLRQQSPGQGQPVLVVVP